MTANTDLNLLHALDALLQECSVTGAAARAHITVPAMSRALGRLRDAVADPLLVRAGRNMVLTPHAISLRDRVHAANEEAGAVLRPAATASLVSLDRTLVVRCSDAVAALLVGPLQLLMEKEAPRLRLRFVPEGEEDAAPLRDGRVDLDIGVVDLVEPELRTRKLLTDRFVGVVRRGHPLSRGRITARRLVAFPHVAVSRQGRASGPLDVALRELGVAREVHAVVPSFLPALFAAASSNLVTTVPGVLAEHAKRMLPIASFALPMVLPPLSIVQVWHPRLDADPAHRWLRDHVKVAVGR